MNAMTPLVHLVDNDEHVLKAYARLLAMEGIDTVTSTSAQDFLSHYDRSIPGCVVLDLVMPGESGLQLQEQMLRNHINVPVVFVSAHGDVPSSVQAMKGGAIDFLTKPVDADALIGAVRRAIEIDASKRAQDDAAHVAQAKLDTLTPREREILPYLVSGKLNKQIAADLGVVEKTVNVHRTHVMEKLQLLSRAELVRFVERLHIATGPDAPDIG
jgi:FixJ family two-component response regulator